MMDESMIVKKEKVVSLESRLVKRASDLRVYQAAFDLSLEIHRMTLGLPKIEQYALGDQMRRASKSICANLAEGFIKQSSSAAEFKRFIGIGLGSASEMQVWADYCRELGYIEPTTATNWIDRYDHIIRMLQTLKNHTK